MKSLGKWILGTLVPSLLLEVSAGSLTSFIVNNTAGVARIERACADNVQQKCIYFDLAVSKSENLEPARALFNSAANMWALATSEVGLRVQLGRAFVSPQNPELDSTTNNSLIYWTEGSDQFNSENLPFKLEFIFGEPTSGIFPIRQVKILMNELGEGNRLTAMSRAIGHSLGLGPSLLKNSIMSDDLRLKRNISMDEVQWLKHLYFSSSTTGNLRGSIVSGNSGAPISRAHVVAILKQDASKFVEALDRTVIRGSSLSGEDGKFVIPSLAPGDYFVLAEPLELAGTTLNKFYSTDMEVVASEYFETEFYDGAERESNLEKTVSFSAQSILFAATLPLNGSNSIDNIKIITNIVKADAEILKADGASSENLAETKPDDGQIEVIYSEVPENSGSGGCAITGENRKSISSFWIIFSTIALLVLTLRVRFQSGRLRE